MTRPSTILKGIASLASILTIVIGLPVALVKLGAFPTSLPTLPGLWQQLTGPDLSGRGAFVVLAVLAWGCWASFTLSVLREIGPAIRTRGQRPARALPGLGWSARPAALMVGAIIAMFVTAPILTATVPPAAAAAAPTPAPRPSAVPTAAQRPGVTKTAATSANTHSAAAAPRASHRDPGARQVAYTVKRHDTLWSIAQRQLGDPLRYTDIAALNPQVGPDHQIHPGQVLSLPTDTQPATAPADGAVTQVTVEAGNTLSGIAAAHGIRDWHTIWPVNAGTAQPAGKHLTNPNHIEPSWRITLGGNLPAAAAQPPAATPPPPAAATQPPASAPAAPTRDPDATRPEPGDQTATLSEPVPAPGAPTPANPTDGNATNDQQPAPAAAAPTGAVDPVLFAAGGLVVVAGVFSALVLARRQQFRNRRPGRTIAASQPPDIALERAAVSVGAPAAEQIARLDQVLRRAFAAVSEPCTVTAAQLTGADMTVHLATPVDLPHPWHPAAAGGALAWTFPASAHVQAAGPDPEDGAIAPFPTLVSIGSDPTSAWLLNLEHTGGLILTGDHSRCLALARVLTAQLALTPWADGICVTLIGFGQELADAAPSRLRYAPTTDLAATAAAAATQAARTADLLTEADTDIAQARRTSLGEETWAPQVLVLAAPATSHPDLPGDDAAAAVTRLLHHVRQPARAGTAVVLLAGQDDTAATWPGTTAHINADGQLTLPGVPTMTADGWSAETSHGVAMLLTHAGSTTEHPIPDATGEQPWHAYSNAAGALREQLVQPRRTPDVHDSSHHPGATCTLPLADQVYLDAGATTTDDLNTLAPNVPLDIAPQLRQADPTLDGDFAAWHDPHSPRAKLALLGPLTARIPGHKPDRVAAWAELIAYLATRENGATVEQVADAFSIAAGTARKYVHIVRELLGDQPDTGQPYLPNATQSPAGKARGVGVYQVSGLLVDADLFRRLRLRGQARGPDGVDDYATALSLVTGPPFSHMRPGTGAWLIEGDRLDFHLTHAIVDVAHLVATHALAAGDTTSARAAVDIARLAAPHEETPRLDAAAITAADGHHPRQMLLDDVCNRADDGQPPPQLNERTRQILNHHRDWLSRAS